MAGHRKLRKFTVDSLKELDFGKVAVAFEKLVQRVVEDCKDRPGVKRARKVTLQFDVEPVLEADGTCDAVAGTFRLKCALPNMESRPYSFGMHANGSLYFNEDAPDNVKQNTFLEDDDEGDE